MSVNTSFINWRYMATILVTFMLAKAQTTEPQVIDFPYEITTDFDATKAANILLLPDVFDVDLDNPYIQLELGDAPELLGGLFGLVDANGSVMAKDMIRSGSRDTIIFSYENTVRADVMFHPRIDAVWDKGVWVEIYDAIDDNPNFSEAVKLYEEIRPFNESSMPRFSDEYYPLITSIAENLIMSHLD
ncbi:MAG: hypothetical protein AAF267_04650 [Deinococcota bacterium]